jgi:signal transduction histidine kinase
MDFNLVTNIESCHIDIPQLLYYSHIPTAIIGLFLGLFVFFKSKDIVGRIFLGLTATFFIWVISNLILWIAVDGRFIMFNWTLFGILNPLLFLCSLYFSYVFINKKDADIKIKTILSFIMGLFVIFSFKNTNGVFDATNCEALENPIFNYFVYGFEFFIFLWILIYGIYKYIKEYTDFRNQILLLIVGVELFLFSFFATGLLASFLAKTGINYSFEIEQYGLFGMTFFMGILAFMIVKFKAFSIKLIGAQALVVSLVLLIGSQFFFIQNNTNRILTGITLALSVGFGYFLIKSVKKEVEQREALELANKEINERKEQLQMMADKLAQANDQLRKLDNAKTEFISIASHQLRTPITAIKGFASLLLEGSYGDISESVHGALEKVYSSAERLVSLIEDLLNVSRIESGRMTFAFENSNVEKLIKELNDNFILIAKTKKFYLDIKLPEVSLPEIIMDYSKIRELVSNFIDNALKYTEKGGVTVKAELRDSGVVIDENGFIIPDKISEFGKMIRITVSDTGIGIPKEEIPYLFKKFSRGKDVSRLHVGGTGLGLYVGKAIAEAHHGQVWVESDGAGLGSRFIIEIPVLHVA